MNDTQLLLEALKKDENYKSKARVLEYWNRVLRSGKKKRIPEEEKQAVCDFAVGEMVKLINLIPAAKNYREQFDMIVCEDNLMGLMVYLRDNGFEFADSDLEVTRTLLSIVERERFIETAVDEMFEHEKIGEEDAKKAIDTVLTTDDDFRRLIFSQGIKSYENRIERFDKPAKAALGEFYKTELTRCLNSEISQDVNEYLEIMADVCKYFADGELLNTLEKTLALPYNNIRFYALETLLFSGREVDASVAFELANDLTYANMTYSALKRYGKTHLFPAELSNPEYLAKSDMIQWLTYPTELGKAPDEIELMGTVKARRSVYYVFKFKSDSENLSDDDKNVYLLGWSSEDGGTFSNFDRLSDFEKKDLNKTLKFIKKKLL